jgi:hypothetical protein
VVAERRLLVGFGFWIGFLAGLELVMICLVLGLGFALSYISDCHDRERI